MRLERKFHSVVSILIVTESQQLSYKFNSKTT
jgi:hypothetical protein